MENTPNFCRLQPSSSLTNILEAQPAAEIMNEGVSDVDLGQDGDNETECDGSATWCRLHWQKSEDRKLVSLVEKYGMGQWTLLAKEMPGRNGKQCRERWHNNLRPNIKKSMVWSEEEERIVVEQHERVGNRWSEIARYVPSRSENAIKNHWNSTKRKLDSTRRITRLGQSNILEEYIRRRRFSDNTSPSNVAGAPPPTTTDNSQIMRNHVYAYSTDYDSIPYLTSDAHDDEMSFMSNLFPR